MQQSSSIVCGGGERNHLLTGIDKRLQRRRHCGAVLMIRYIRGYVLDGVGEGTKKKNIVFHQFREEKEEEKKK